VRRMGWLMAVVVVSAGVLAGPVGAAGAQTARQSGTWVGTVEAHAGHFDYVGRPCPVEVEFCAAFIARYRIVPLTREARTALAEAEGGTATLEGFLVSLGDGTHHGVLFVWTVEPSTETPG
jgi:hypothetical protein